ncbi:MAG: response regulator transcription factor [Propionibacteriaceae bacterium]|nr:response regulator transcription factor [Propionibacteriaceae bacterium]
MSTVLLVEDDDTLREALVYMLRREGHDVRAAADGQAALDGMSPPIPDIVLLDLMIPLINGIEVCRRIRQTSDVPIIMLTARNSEADIVLGLEVGADDYVTKPFSTPELLARIRSAIRRGRAEAKAKPADVLTVGEITMDVSRHRVTVGTTTIALPLKEFELLHLFMRNKGRVITRPQLLKRLWGTEFPVDTKTLDVHIRRLRSKIEADPANPQRLTTIRGVGYRMEPD